MTWSTAFGGGEGCIRFTSANNILIKGEELNAIVANVVAQVKKKRDKATATNDSGSKDDPENYNIENINIGRDSKAE